MSISTLTPIQDHVLALLSAGSTVTAAAKSAGIHRNTIANWRGASPAFLDAYNQAETEKALLWREQAEQLAAAAIDAIRSILTDPKTPAGVRLKAALVILDKVSTPVLIEGVPEPQPVQPEIVHKPAQSAQPAQFVKTNPSAARPPARPGRNQSCPCGSGRKFKHCCINRPQALTPRETAA